MENHGKTTKKMENWGYHNLGHLHLVRLGTTKYTKSDFDVITVNVTYFKEYEIHEFSPIIVDITIGVAGIFQWNCSDFDSRLMTSGL